MRTRKSIVCLLFCFIFLLTGCKSEEAKAVDDAILTIGQVSSENAQSVKDAYAMYEALSQEQKEEVENFDILNEANNFVAAMEFDEMLETLIRDIAQKNIVTIEKVDALQAQYDELPQSQKDLVINVELLAEAREKVYTNILAEADRYYNEMYFLEAYQLYLQLPQDYPGFDKSKFAVCKRLNDVSRTWVPKDSVSFGSNAVEYTPIYASITLGVDTSYCSDVEDYLETPSLSLATVLSSDEVLSRSVFALKTDYIKEKQYESISVNEWFRPSYETPENEVYLGNCGTYSQSKGVRIFLDFYIFYNEEANELRVETVLNSSFLKTTVSHYYVPAE